MEVKDKQPLYHNISDKPPSSHPQSVHHSHEYSFGLKNKLKSFQEDMQNAIIDERNKHNATQVEVEEYSDSDEGGLIPGMSLRGANSKQQSEAAALIQLGLINVVEDDPFANYSKKYNPLDWVFQPPDPKAMDDNTSNSDIDDDDPLGLGDTANYQDPYFGKPPRAPYNNGRLDNSTSSTAATTGKT